MSDFEVSQPILNSPYTEPESYWLIRRDAPAELQMGRRPAQYLYRDPAGNGDGGTIAVDLPLVNRIRELLKRWRAEGYPGASRTTLDLLNYWQREGRAQRLFFAQIEAAETVIFLKEARADFLQGIDVPLDEPGEDKKTAGMRAFQRYGLKLATGSGKTTVMGMLAAWSILNKVHSRGDQRFSDVVLAVCPNVTIRNRLGELDPNRGEASLYRTRDLVPADAMPDLCKGRVLITNWHVFEPKSLENARVVKAGVMIRSQEKLTIGPKNTTAHGKRYITEADLQKQINAGLVVVESEERDGEGHLKSVLVQAERYVESDTSLLNRVLGREVGGKQNILVFNDEAHHAYRIRPKEEGQEELDLFGEEEQNEEFYSEATVWVDGLDKIHKQRGINFAVDFSATPYYLGRVGQDSNRVFPWVVCDFGLTDAIESGLVKIPQMVVRGPDGSAMPGYFNVWKWILEKLTPAEKGGKKSSPKPEAVLKWAATPISMLGGLWHDLRQEWEASRQDPRPPVFIIVCKNTKIAQVIYAWLAENKPPLGVPVIGISDFVNTNGVRNTIRVDSKVVAETDTGETRDAEERWMRLTLDTVGKMDWPRDPQGRPMYPEDFEELAEKLKRPLHPPGRDVRCIVSVGMLTEGWDCNTVTHIIGLRPFMSQLLCEQVVGRGLRRTSYDVGEDGKLTEEVAKVFGVPFEFIPFKAGPAPVKRERRNHVYALPQHSEFEIKFPRVQGYRQAIRNRIHVDWDSIATLKLDPINIPPEVQMKAILPTNSGRPSLFGPGKLVTVDLNPFRRGHRLQELAFDLARDLTRQYATQPSCDIPTQVLFPQLLVIVRRYLMEKIQPVAPAEVMDVFLSPYYGWVIERLSEAISPDTGEGEAPELPIYETNRGPGSTADVDYWTSKETVPVLHSHLNAVIPDTTVWEQSAAYRLDKHDRVRAFVKNAGLGFAIPYLFNGQMHDYVPDFIIRFNDRPEHYLILETKGFDPLKEVKAQAAKRWVKAVNAEGSFGEWEYAVVTLDEVDRVLNGSVRLV